MFNGDERTAITTTVSEEDFEKKAQEAFEPLGEMDLSGGGSFTIAPKASLVSFFSTVTITGKIKQSDDGYQVSVQYAVAPSPACWILAIALFCFTLFGAAIIIAPLLIDKPTVAKAVENALRDLKDAVGAKKKSRKSESED
jgi:hypothetical protein